MERDAETEWRRFERFWAGKGKLVMRTTGQSGGRKGAIIGKLVRPR